MTAAPFCCRCRRTDVDLRPYGPKGKPICLSCSQSSPELKREAERRLRRAFDRAGDVPVIRADGPPVSLEEAHALGGNVVFIDTATGRPIRKGRA